MALQKRTVHHRYLTLFFLLLCALLKAQNITKELENAGDNKQALLNVLTHYKTKGEDEKYKAACFLIKNMHNHWSTIYDWVNSDGNSIHFSELNYEDFDVALEAFNSIKDSIAITSKLNATNDLMTISSDFLIHNIDAAFKEWKENPWSRAYNFNTFCEYILPYRTFYEPLKDWRENYRFLVHNAAYKLTNTSDPVEMCRLIIDELVDFDFVIRNPLASTLLTPEQLLFRRQGTCPDMANLVMMASRAFGVAVTFDFTPHYGASSNRHYWNTVIDTLGQHIPFNGRAVNEIAGLPHNYKPNTKRLAKVYRRTFSEQKDALAFKISTNNIPEGFLKNKNTVDVTNTYVPVGHISIYAPINVKPQIAYLSVYNRQRWEIVTWAERNSNTFKFNNLGRHIIYLPVFFVNKTRHYGDFPILLQRNGNSSILKPNYTKSFPSTITLSNVTGNEYVDKNSVFIEAGSTYHLSCWDKEWRHLETAIATKKGVYFKNIPENALLRLLPEKPDKFERIFILEKATGTIEWY